MVGDFEELVKDWQINSAKSEAIHRTGLGFKCNNRSLGDDMKLEINNLPKWYSEQRALGFSSDQIDEKMQALKEEFKEIYQKVIIPERDKFPSSLKQIRGSYE